MRKNYISVLNVIACFFVVVLHVNSDFWNYSSDLRWMSSNIVECIGYCAVPIFFMISGANLIGYEEKYNTKEYIKKRIKKTGIPYLAWTIFGIVFLIITKKINIDSLCISYLIDGIANSKFVDVYWFFIPLFGIYIGIIFCSLIPIGKRKRAYGALILWSGITMSVLPTIFKIINIEYNYNLCAGLVNGYLIFPLIGYWVDNYDIKRKSRILIYVLGIMGFGIHFFGTAFESNAGTVSLLFKGYTNFPAILYSAAIFVWFKYHNNYNEKIIKIVNAVEKRTFGVYMIHIFIVKICIKIGLINENLIAKLIASVGIFLGTYIVVYAMQKTPILRKIVP